MHSQNHAPKKLIKKAMPETTVYKTNGNVGFLEYIALNEYPWLMNAFSTRQGGVSAGQYSEMNLSFTVGDSPEKVRENYRIFGEAIGVKCEEMVFSAQTHTDNVMRVDSFHKGMGISRDRDFNNIDGLITSEPGLCLVCSFADCVPLYFVDPVNKCIGLSHSGWKGTVSKIGEKTIDLMNREFGSKASDLLCCIGPCISKECYEVSGDVADEFRKAFTTDQFEEICKPADGKDGKYLLDLPLANYHIFADCGVKPGKIVLPDLCTSCNSDILHSHRASGGKRGGMCAFLMIRESARLPHPFQSSP